MNRLEVAGANVLSSLAILNSEYNEEAAEEQAISEK